MSRASRMTISALAVVILTAGCGGSQKPHVPTRTSPPKAQVAVGAAAIRRALARELDARTVTPSPPPTKAERALGASDAAEFDFDLGHPLTHEDLASGYTDCYVVLAGIARLEAFHPASNFLLSPYGATIFVQSGSTIPLRRCMDAVRTALGWVSGRAG